MKKLLIRMDDLGYTEGVTLGMLKVQEYQPIASAGFMVNELFSEQAVAITNKQPGLCLGIHISFTSGVPATNPKDIPSLVDGQGNFLNSNHYRELIWAGKEPFPVIEDVETEMRAQIEKFLKLFGRTPEYIDLHAIQSDNFIKAINKVGKEFGIPSSPYYPEVPIERAVMVAGEKLDFSSTESMLAYFTGDNELVDGVNLLVTHPALLDKPLFDKSSLNEARMYDYALLTDPAFYDWLKANDVELISFRDLKVL